MNCEAELCTNWTGNGCICAVLDLAPEHGIYCECDKCDNARHAQDFGGVGKLTPDRADWRERAACRLSDAALFDPPGELGKRVAGPVTQNQAAALEVCANCPVSPQCLVDAKQHGDSGVRGGFVLEVGRVIGRAAAPPAEWAALLGWHAEFTRCKKWGEQPSKECVTGEREYQAENYRRRARRRKAA